MPSRMDHALTTFEANQMARYDTDRAPSAASVRVKSVHRCRSPSIWGLTSSPPSSVIADANLDGSLIAGARTEELSEQRRSGNGRATRWGA
jgi:hypothetical protein